MDDILVPDTVHAFHINLELYMTLGNVPVFAIGMCVAVSASEKLLLPFYAQKISNSNDFFGQNLE